MPERLDIITVQTRHRFLPMPWDSRQALLAELRRDDALRPTVTAFEAVGATRPVEIPHAQGRTARRGARGLGGEVGGDLPEGAVALHDALKDELG